MMSVGFRVLTGGVGESQGYGLESVDSSSIQQKTGIENKSICFDLLTNVQVSEEIHQSCCGLALSAEEGMMLASTEYLLCGRPVVSTHSQGGRDIYYDVENSIIVDDTPEAVQNGVEFWLRNPPDRQKIRRDVIRKLNVYRYAYCRKISSLQASRGGVPECPEKIFYDLFVNEHVSARRYHAPGSLLTGQQLQQLSRYPDTEILLKKSDCFKVQKKDGELSLVSNDAKLKLDEISSWVYSQLNGHKTISCIIDELAAVYGKSNQINNDVHDTIATFIGSGVVNIANQVK